MCVYVCSLETVRFKVYDGSLIFIGFHMLLKLFHLVCIHVNCSAFFWTMSVYAMYTGSCVVCYTPGNWVIIASSHISSDSLPVIIVSFLIHYHIVFVVDLTAAVNNINPCICVLVYGLKLTWLLVHSTVRLLQLMLIQIWLEVL